MHTYLPQQQKIISVKDLTLDTKLFKLEMDNLKFIPGQFVMAGINGFGEAPFSISSSPSETDYIDLTIRSVGRLTRVMHKYSAGDTFTVRGPYGNGFSIHQLKNKRILLISGGCGLAPMRSLINFEKDQRNYFQHMQILYGTRSPENIYYQDEVKSWQKFAEVIITVDKTNSKWHGNTGLITTLINKNTISSKNTAALICGPPVMYEAVSKKLLAMGFSGDDIYLSLERNMQCGIGTCQHCTCGEKYVCKDGPVFTYNQIKYQSYKGD